MTRHLALTAALLLIATGGALAKDHGKGKGRGHGKPDKVVFVFAGDDRRIVQEYCRGQRSSLPPGLAKRGGALPPGLEKQLRKNGKLPPGLDHGTIYAFPVELERRLPPLGPDLRRGFIEGRAVIYNSRTSVVLDVFIPL